MHQPIHRTGFEDITHRGYGFWRFFSLLLMLVNRISRRNIIWRYCAFLCPVHYTITIQQEMRMTKHPIDFLDCSHAFLPISPVQAEITN